MKKRPFPIAILSTPGGQELAKKIDQNLKTVFQEHSNSYPDSFIRISRNYRFQNGEGKGVIVDSIRGTDLYIIVDINNHSVGYTRYNTFFPLSPDEHFQDLRRLLGAAKNMASRTTLIMPLLYASRQHKIRLRESLDCALALQELVRLGVNTVMTIDAHDSQVMNAIPMHSLENLHAAYELIKAFLTYSADRFSITPEELVICSPDLGGLERARYYAEHFRVHLAAFYKFRDLTRVVDGKNPILEYKFLGNDVRGKHILVTDDMLSSGGSLLEVSKELKHRGVKKIYYAVTFALFSHSVDQFDKAYEDGLFDVLFATNASFVPDEIRKKSWFISVDITCFIATFIHTFNQDGSISSLLDSTEKINRLLGYHMHNQENPKTITGGLFKA